MVHSSLWFQVIAFQSYISLVWCTNVTFQNSSISIILIEPARQSSYTRVVAVWAIPFNMHVKCCHVNMLPWTGSTLRVTQQQVGLAFEPESYKFTSPLECRGRSALLCCIELVRSEMYECLCVLSLQGLLGWKAGGRQATWPQTLKISLFLITVLYTFFCSSSCHVGWPWHLYTSVWPVGP